MLLFLTAALPCLFQGQQLFASVGPAITTKTPLVLLTAIDYNQNIGGWRRRAIARA